MSKPSKPGSTLLLTDDVLMALAMRSDLLSQFPFLRLQIGSVPSTCRCNRPAALRQAQIHATHAVKNSLLALPANRLDALKKALGADRLEFFTRSGKHTL